MKKMNNYWGGYQAPALEVLDVTIENGFAASLEFGDAGYAGKDGYVNDYDGDEL